MFHIRTESKDGKKHHYFYLVKLTIYADCCFAGKWVKQLEAIKKKKNSILYNLAVRIYAAAAEDEIAHEKVFSSLFKQ